MAVALAVTLGVTPLKVNVHEVVEPDPAVKAPAVMA